MNSTKKSSQAKTELVILAHARSGSTSLAKYLNGAENFNVLIEPFHDSFEKWNPTERDYPSFIKNQENLDFALKEIFAKYDAFKTLIYQLDYSQYKSILTRSSTKVLFLYRENLLHAALSAKIAEQTGFWQTEDIDDPKKYLRLNDLDIADMKKMIDFLTIKVEQYKNLLKAKRSEHDYRVVTYEDLFLRGEDSTKKILNGLCTWIGIDLPSVEYFNKYMKKDDLKISDNYDYSLVPNYQQILNYFSGNQNGK